MPRGGVLRRTLAACSIEGMFAEIVSACAGGAVLTGWALHVGCSPLLLAVLSALPFAAQIAHVPAAWLVATRSARRFAIGTVLLSRLAYLALAALPLVATGRAAQQLGLVAIVAASSVFAVLGNHAWQVWMADVVPAPLRGRYFGRRIALCTAASAVASVLASVVLDDARASAKVGPALASLAVVAAIAGVISAVFMARQHEAPPDPSARPPTLRDALAPLSDRAARAFIEYQAAWHLASGLTVGFFAVYLLEVLHTGFVGVALHGFVMALARMLAAPHWGRAIDRAGARVVLAWATAGTALLPALWVAATPSFLAPLVLDAIAGGVLLGGQSLAALAIPMTFGRRRDRPYYVASFALTAAPSFAVGAAAAGALLAWIPLRALFLIAVVARVGVAARAFATLDQPRGAGTRRAR